MKDFPHESVPAGLGGEKFQLADLHRQPPPIVMLWLFLDSL